MENNIDNYEKLVSQYWMQNVLRLKEYPNTPIQVNAHTLLKYCHNNESFLELTPLHLISDEDAKHVAKLINPLSPINDNSIEKLKEMQISFTKGFLYKNYNFSIDISDFIRSKGYALPYNGLSVEQQVDYGWVKLRSEI